MYVYVCASKPALDLQNCSESVTLSWMKAGEKLKDRLELKQGDRDETTIQIHRDGDRNRNRRTGRKDAAPFINTVLN